MGPEPPQLSDGFGGWQIVPRPRRRSYTKWDSAQPFKMRLTVVFDDWRTGVSVEPQIAKLEQLGRPRGDGLSPPIIDIDGAVPHNDRSWVIDNIEWGTVLRRIQAPHHRVRQEATLTLIQYVSVDKLSEKATETAKKGKGKYRMYTIKKNDTLSKLAARFLGNYRRWHEIAKLNGIRDPNHLKTGRRIRIPPR